MVEEQDLNKSEALKRCVDTHLEHEGGASLTNYEDAALDGAVFSAISTIAVATSTLIGLLPFMEGLLLASVLLGTGLLAVIAVGAVQQGLLGGGEQ